MGDFLALAASVDLSPLWPIVRIYCVWQSATRPLCGHICSLRVCGDRKLFRFTFMRQSRQSLQIGSEALLSNTSNCYYQHSLGSVSKYSVACCRALMGKQGLTKIYNRFLFIVAYYPGKDIDGLIAYCLQKQIYTSINCICGRDVTNLRVLFRFRPRLNTRLLVHKGLRIYLALMRSLAQK